MDEKITRLLAQRSGEPQALLEQLCRQPSVAAQNKGIAEMASLVEGLLKQAGFATRQLKIEGAPPAVYGELKGRSPFTLLLYDHYDVQPPEPLELWQTPPYQPFVRDGKLYARGVSDDKGEIASRLSAVRMLLEAYGELPITLRWIIEGEEEIGSPHFGLIVRNYAELLKADGCLWEGSSFDTEDRPQLTLGFKGLLYVQYDAQQLSMDAHSGTAATLPSAAWRLVEALSLLRDASGKVRIPGFYDAVKEPSQAQVAALADQPDTEAYMRSHYQVDRFVDGLTGLELRKHAAFAPTSNIAGLLSGYTGEGAKTVLPARAMAKMDFRLVPDQDPADILGKLRKHLDDEGYADVKITQLSGAEPVVTPMDHPLVQRIKAIAEAFSGKPAHVSPLGGGTLPFLGDLRRYVGVPGLASPGNVGYIGSGAHAPNEHIRLSDLERAVQFNCYMFQELGK